MKNFRDLSYINLKKNMILRSEALANLDINDQDLLLNKHNLKLVIDLRTPHGFETQKDMQLAGVKYVNIPLMTDDEIKSLEINDCYAKAVCEDKKDVWTKIFNLLLDNSDGAILFHCSSGKDRTGIVISLILSCLGINKEVIYQDYLLSNKSLKVPFKYKLRLLFASKEAKQNFYAYFWVQKAYLDSVFSEIDNLYGSINGFFIKCCGLNEDKIKRLKEKYLND